MNFRLREISVLCLAMTGCLSGPEIVPCPLSVVEQATSVRELAPLGAPREEVLARLKTAGITGSFGANQSIYYCDLWERSDGSRWHIDVALLFDEAGRVYGMRPEPFTVTTTGVPTSRRETEDTAGAESLPDYPDDPFAGPAPARGSGARTPFVDSSDGR